MSITSAQKLMHAIDTLTTSLQLVGHDWTHLVLSSLDDDDLLCSAEAFFEGSFDCFYRDAKLQIKEIIESQDLQGVLLFEQAAPELKNRMQCIEDDLERIELDVCMCLIEQMRRKHHVISQQLHPQTSDPALESFAHFCAQYQIPILHINRHRKRDDVIWRSLPPPVQNIHQGILAWIDKYQHFQFRLGMGDFPQSLFPSTLEPKCNPEWLDTAIELQFLVQSAMSLHFNQQELLSESQSPDKTSTPSSQLFFKVDLNDVQNSPNQKRIYRTQSVNIQELKNRSEPLKEPSVLRIQTAPTIKCP